MSDKKLTEEEFTLKAIKGLRTGQYKGIHTVYSGFNSAFRKYFEGGDPVAAVTALATAGKISMRGARGGCKIGLPGEVVDKTKADLEKIMNA